MIVRDEPSAWQLLFVMRGSIVPTIAPRLAVVTLLSVAVVAAQEEGLVHFHEIAALPFSLIGIALSIFAGFRNSACYDRWWEGRKVFGQLLVDTRSLARQELGYLGPDNPAQARRGAFACIAFAHLLRHHMRGAAPGDEALAALEEAGAPTSRRPATRRKRIKSMPVPYTYTLILHRTAYLFCLLLPFGLAAAAGPWTPLVVAIVSYTFFGLDALGDELENPFGTGQNALPLSAMTRGIEIDIREMLGEAVLPDALKPTAYLLT